MMRLTREHRRFNSRGDCAGTEWVLPFLARANRRTRKSLGRLMTVPTRGTRSTRRRPGRRLHLMTPFHNMAIIAPDTTPGDIDRHTRVFAEAVGELVARSGPSARAGLGDAA